MWSVSAGGAVVAFCPPFRHQSHPRLCWVSGLLEEIKTNNWNVSTTVFIWMVWEIMKDVGLYCTSRPISSHMTVWVTQGDIHELFLVLRIPRKLEPFVFWESGLNTFLIRNPKILYGTVIQHACYNIYITIHVLCPADIQLYHWTWLNLKLAVSFKLHVIIHRCIDFIVAQDYWLKCFQDIKDIDWKVMSWNMH